MLVSFKPGQKLGRGEPGCQHLPGRLLLCPLERETIENTIVALFGAVWFYSVLSIVTIVFLHVHGVHIIFSSSALFEKTLDVETAAHQGTSAWWYIHLLWRPGDFEVFFIVWGYIQNLSEQMVCGCWFWSHCWDFGVLIVVWYVDLDVLKFAILGGRGSLLRGGKEFDKDSSKRNKWSCTV